MSRNLPLEGYRPLDIQHICPLCGTQLTGLITYKNGRKEKIYRCLECGLTKNPEEPIRNSQNGQS